ncbi:MAG: hypothetical protein COB50_02055, partial [Thiotrichales bacterium]
MREKLLVDIFGKLGTGHLLLTANNRLNLYLQKRFNDFHKNSVWPESIQSFNGFWHELWQRLSESHSLPTLLTPQQTTHLWQNTIEKWYQTNEIPKCNVRSIAKAAEEAWSICKQWNISLDNLANCDFPETKNFVLWAEAITVFYQENNFTDNSSALRVLCDALSSIDNNQLENLLPKSIQLIGYIDKPPVLLQLLNLLKQYGCDYEFISVQQEIAKAQSMHCYLSKEDELRGAIEYAHKELAKNSNKKIAIVVPDLHTQYHNIKRYCKEIFSPEKLLLHQPEQKPKYAISAGEALHKVPIIHDVLALFRTKLSPNLSDIKQLLLSPFMSGGISNYQDACQIERALLENLTDSVSIAGVKNFLQKNFAKSPVVITLLEFLELPTAKKTSIAEWKKYFLKLLQIFGWPQERVLTSAEHQAVAKFYDVLDNLEIFAIFDGKITFYEVTHLLQLCLQKSLFQPQSAKDAGLQILGVFEAHGLCFDEIWICDTTSNAWPKMAKPSKLLPIKLQLELNTP